tara:strand:+ start:8268 stop:8753 length:486 start_codon:yes stop_codon:yes gene_type:complete
MEVVAIASTVFSAMAQLTAGERAKEQYEQRARNEELNARIEAVNARKKGVEALKRTNASLASIIAGSPKQGLALSSGTVLDRGVFRVARPASQDFSDTSFNASMALLTGQMRAYDFRQAGDLARLQGQIGAATTIGQGAYAYSQIKPSGSGLSQTGNQPVA